jgi:hypothetical protein
MNSSGDGGITCIASIDLERVGKRLNARAHAMARFMPDVFNNGISVEDVVSEVWLAFFGSPTLLGWDPAKGQQIDPSEGSVSPAEANLERFLKKILRCRMIDHIRRNTLVNRRFPTSIDDPKFIPHGAGDPELDYVELMDLLERLKDVASGDKETELLIDAAMGIVESGKVDQQLGRLLGKPPASVRNVRKRLQRKLVASERLEWWTKAINSRK